MTRNRGIWDELESLFERWPWWAPVGLGALVGWGIAIAIPILAANFMSPLGIPTDATIWKPAGRALGLLLFTGFIYRGFSASSARRSRKAILKRADTLAGVRLLGWREFESLVQAALEARGYSVTQTPSGADGGIDLVACRGGETALVQCKHWKVQQVGVTKIRELYGVVSAKRAHKGIMVTSGDLTKEARAFAAESGIEVIDAATLEGFLAVRAQTPAHTNADEASSPIPTTKSSAECPVCGAPMVQRVARRGPREGSPFMGCSKFPKCRGTVAI